MAKFLIIDDSIIVFKMIKRIIEPLGHEIVGYAKNGKEGLEMLAECNPDIITMDLAMPVMDGFEASYEISKNYPLFINKVVILSSMGDESIVEELSKFGVQNFLVKPVKESELVDMIEKINALSRC